MPTWEYATVIRHSAAGRKGSVYLNYANGDDRCLSADDGSVPRAHEGLAQAGRDGWELCGIERPEGTSATVYWLKRPAD